MEELKAVVRTASCKHVLFVHQQKVKDQKHMERELAAAEAIKGEGLMLRLPGSKYERDRSWTLLNVRP
jgi:DNA ligase-1